MSQPTIAGLDIAKRVFQVHLADDHGECIERVRIKRDDLAPYFAKLPPITIAMESCANAYHWADVFAAQGHTPRLVHTLAVAKLRTSQKNDPNDASTITLAASLPNTRFVAYKTPEQRTVLALHNLRKSIVATRTKLANQILGMLADFGHVEITSIYQLDKLTPAEVRRSFHSLPKMVRTPFAAAVARIQALGKEKKIVEAAIQDWHDTCGDSQRLEDIPGVGVLLATTLCATVGTAESFKSGRELAAWFQLVPRQYSSGDKTVLGHIGHGNPYVRKLLYMGAAGVMLRMYQKQEGPAFVVRLHKRGKPGKVIIFAIAHKIVRTAWRMLRDHSAFRESNEWRPVKYEGVKSRRQIALEAAASSDFTPKSPRRMAASELVGRTSDSECGEQTRPDQESSDLATSRLDRTLAL